jgi:hypothetical protein
MTVMFLKCFKLFYIKDNSVENSIDFIKKKKKKNDSPLRLLLWVIVCDLHVTFMGREEREEKNYFAKFYRKKMKWSERCKI